MRQGPVPVGYMAEEVLKGRLKIEDFRLQIGCEVVHHSCTVPGNTVK